MVNVPPTRFVQRKLHCLVVLLTKFVSCSADPPANAFVGGLKLMFTLLTFVLVEMVIAMLFVVAMLQFCGKAITGGMCPWLSTAGGLRMLTETPVSWTLTNLDACRT